MPCPRIHVASEPRLLRAGFKMIYTSVVSHGHLSTIAELDVLGQLNGDVDIMVLVLDNVGEDGLQEWCNQRDIAYRVNDDRQGFGANNNTVFSILEREFDLDESDYFLVVNPDVIVAPEQVKAVISEMQEFGAVLATCNLFRDLNRTLFDPSVRRYPKASDFLKSFLLGYNPSIIDKSEVNEPVYVDWAAGSFLMFQVSLYRRLGGFDESYFMYCEDIDICLRSHLLFGERVLYIPQVRIVHWAQHQNRSVFSRHFLWHLRSIAAFLRRKRSYIKAAAGASNNRV